MPQDCTTGSKSAGAKLIGYVGSTGNAAEDAPHLHFAFLTCADPKWWQGTAINPYLVLR